MPRPVPSPTPFVPVPSMSVLLVPVLVVLVGVAALVWWWPNRGGAGEAAPAPGRFASLSFAPFRDGQSPLAGRFPTEAEVDADLALLAPHTRAIRTYAAIEGEYEVPALAAKHGLKVWLGLWLGRDRAANAREIARGIELARAHPRTVERVVVGNEVLLRRDLSPAELIDALDRVRAAVPQPVTYAEVWEFWERFPEVAAHVDAVTVHLLPYWEDRPTGIDGAVAQVAAVYRRMAARFAGKPVAIGETGWPGRGRARGDAAPGGVEQARFVREFAALAAREGFDYNLIEAFDQGWKYGHEGVVGANWGLWTADRRPKYPAAAPVVQDPHWRAGAVATALLGLLLLGGASFARPGPRPRAQAGLAVLAFALGLALAYAHARTWPVVYDWHLRLAAAVNLCGQTLLAALVMRRAARVFAGVPSPPPRTGAEATERVRRLLLLRGPGGDDVLDDLSFLFLWTAAVLQLLLVFDPRYREFPLAAFAVPVVAMLARAVLRDLPRGDLLLPRAGREEAWAGGVLAFGALVGAALEGLGNTQSLAWGAAALVLALPALLRLRPPGTRPRGVDAHASATRRGRIESGTGGLKD